MYLRTRAMHMHHDPSHHAHHGPGRHRARRGAIRASILRLLAERPMHGYELIGELDQRTGGRWRPSPGSVYPSLALLEDEGLIRSADSEGERKRFELTDEGRRWLAEHADETPWARASSSRRGELRRLAGEVLGQLQQIGRFGTAAQNERARAVLDQARRDLYAVLASPDEAPTAHADTPPTTPPAPTTPDPD